MSGHVVRRAPERVLRAGSLSALACSTAVSAYLGGLAVLAWSAIARGQHRARAAAAPSMTIAVLIPAHDEERLIGATVRSACAARYPSGLSSVHVVADNCSDRTAEIAAANGAIVHEHQFPGGKGAALAHVIRRLGEDGRPPGAVAIVDADTLIDPEFLVEIAARLESGDVAVQGYYAVRDPTTSPVTALRAAALAVRHYLRPLARTSIGGSSGLYGNGMAFRYDVAAAHDWSSHLTEDIEMQLELLLGGARIAFAPAAVVAAEMPDTLDAATTQNQRWERGRVELLRAYLPRLLRRGPRRAVRIDAAVDLAIPPFSVLAAATMAATAGAVALGPRRGRALAIGAAAALSQAFYLASGLTMTRAPWALWRSLLHAPRMVAWKIGLWARVVRRSDAATWSRTTRNAADEGALE
jgi:cellulose synthase/poly-beta-1,6-N-acetylglucosamine synthase-like glycosyltransferase